MSRCEERMSAARIAEAQECEKKAAECLKTSFLKMKLKPDYDGAATSLERAAVCYRNADQQGKAAATLEKAASYYEEVPNKFHAAKAREGAAQLRRDLGEKDAARDLFAKAIEGYAEAGSMDTAAQVVDRAAKSMSTADPKSAIDLYTRGLALVQQADRSGMAGEFLSQITKLRIRLEDYVGARESIRDEIEKYLEVRESLRVGQLTIGLILVQLARGDSVAATKDFFDIASRCPNFEETDDARVCRSLIASYEAGDDATFKSTLQSGTLRSMDNDFIRLQKKLKVPVVEKSGGGGDYDEDEDDEDLK